MTTSAPKNQNNPDNIAIYCTHMRLSTTIYSKSHHHPIEWE